MVIWCNRLQLADTQAYNSDTNISAAWTNNVMPLWKHFVTRCYILLLDSIVSSITQCVIDETIESSSSIITAGDKMLSQWHDIITILILTYRRHGLIIVFMLIIVLMLSERRLAYMYVIMGISYGYAWVLWVLSTRRSNQAAVYNSGWQNAFTVAWHY